jgi:hypothetical protein
MQWRLPQRIWRRPCLEQLDYRLVPSLNARCSGLYRFRLVTETEGALVGKQPDYCLMPVLGCEMQHPLLLQVGGGEGAPLSIYEVQRPLLLQVCYVSGGWRTFISLGRDLKRQLLRHMRTQ